MKALYNKCFLFSKHTETNWSKGKKIGFYIWNYLIMLLAAMAIGMLSLALASGPYVFFKAYLENAFLILLNILPPVVLMFLFYAIFGRPWLAFFLDAFICLGLTVANYYKLLYRDDPLMFGDLLLIKEAGNMMGKYGFALDRKLILIIVFFIIGTALMFLFVRAKPKAKVRIIEGLLIIAIAFGDTPKYIDNTLYSSTVVDYSYIKNIWSSTQKYISHGFIYPFFHSITTTVEVAPDDYNKTEAAQMLAEYTSADIPADKKVNFVSVMLEAYNDFTKFDVPGLSPDVYKVWHDLENEGYSGNLVTNIFAGGTVDTERSYITGYSKLNSFRGSTNSYAWYFRDQGYKVEGMHPSHDWFYNRVNINEFLGFENYYFMENYYNDFMEGSVAYDTVFFRELRAKYEEATELDTPYFNFSVTYQGHGPYPSDHLIWPDTVTYINNNGQYTTEEQHMLENYFGGIYDTNKKIKEFTDFLREDDEPVVLVLFGDHNPWMGDGNTGYDAMGIDLSMKTQKSFLDYYSTRYIIWANPAAKEILGDNFTGEGPDIGPYFLMNQVFDLCGFEGPAYMQASREVSQKVPVQHITKQYVQDGVLTDTLTPENAELVKKFDIIQYYERNNFTAPKKEK